MRFPFQGVTQDGNGKVMQGATVSTFLTGTTTAADVYAASSGGTAVNSVTSDSVDGTFVFWVDESDHVLNQRFRVTISLARFTTQIVDDIPIFPFPDQLTDSAGASKLQVDTTSTAADTAMLLWDVNTGAKVRVSVGANDSGGGGFKVLRIPN